MELKVLIYVVGTLVAVLSFVLTFTTVVVGWVTTYAVLRYKVGQLEARTKPMEQYAADRVRFEKLEEKVADNAARLDEGSTTFKSMNGELVAIQKDISHVKDSLQMMDRNIRGIAGLLGDRRQFASMPLDSEGAS